MSALTRDELLAATNVPIERVDLPELGTDAHVYVRGMSGKERDAFEISLAKGPRGQRRNLDNFRARLTVLCVVDQDGTRLYQSGDAELVGNIRVDVLAKIVAVAQRLSGITEADADELGKNSGDPVASAGSSSSSRSS